jgi:hypothetical protein
MPEGGSMYASIRKYKVRTGTLDDLIPRVKAELAPILEKMPGFVAYYTVDSHDGFVTALTIAENRETAEALTRSSVEWAKKNLGNALSDPDITIGEVAVALAPQQVRAAGGR